MYGVKEGKGEGGECCVREGEGNMAAEDILGRQGIGSQN